MMNIHQDVYFVFKYVHCPTCMWNFIVFNMCEKFSATMHVTEDKHGLDETFSFVFACQSNACLWRGDMSWFAGRGRGHCI